MWHINDLMNIIIQKYIIMYEDVTSTYFQLDIDIIQQNVPVEDRATRNNQ